MRYDVVTIVASPRGTSQLCELVSQLPPGFGIPIVCLVQTHSRLIAELAACTRLNVKVARPNETLQPGCVYLPPPGTSTVMVDGPRMVFSPFGVESSAQHPVDRFLESAGRVYGKRALAVMLAGFPDDGAEGAHNLKWRGGTLLVLDRATAEYCGMAEAIVRAGSYDRIITAGEVANALLATFTSRDLLATAELQFELGLLLDSALIVSGTHMGNVQVAEPVRERLHIVAHRGLATSFLDRFSMVRAYDQSASARAFVLRRRVVIEDVFADTQYAPYRDVARESGYRAVQSTPIMGVGEVDGVLSTLYPDRHVVSENEGRNLDELAAAAQKFVVDFR